MPKCGTTCPVWSVSSTHSLGCVPCLCLQEKAALELIIPRIPLSHEPFLGGQLALALPLPEAKEGLLGL